MKIILILIISISGYFTFDSIVKEDKIEAHPYWSDEDKDYEDRYIHKHNEEMFELMEYKHELFDNYDWDTMTDAEVELAWMEIEELLVEKAEELGIDYENYGYGRHFGFMRGRYYSGDMNEYMEYKFDLINSYDWDTMTEQETTEAKTEIEKLLAQKKAELDLEDSYYGSRRRGYGPCH